MSQEATLVPQAAGLQPQADLVYALAVAPDFDRDGVGFAARGSGLYRSGDGGATWTPAYGSLQLGDALATLAVAVSPAFAADHTVWAGVQGAVLRSGDGGHAWEVIFLPTPPPLVTGHIRPRQGWQIGTARQPHGAWARREPPPEALTAT